MKQLAMSLALAVSATPVLAHSGAHLHPHSVEGWVIGFGAILAGVLATLALKARK